MSPEEAENIFDEFGDVLANKWQARPEKYGAHLKGVSRAGLRKAIHLWLAKQRYEGVDILHRSELTSGERVAALELVQKVWWFTFGFGPPIRDGIPIPDSREEQHEASVKHDEFVDFLLKLDRSDADYWQKVQATLT